MMTIDFWDSKSVKNRILVRQSEKQKVLGRVVIIFKHSHDLKMLHFRKLRSIENLI